MEEKFLNELTYARDEPDVESIRKIYEKDLSDAVGWQDQCADSYNQRRCWWPGKSRDQKQSGPNALPWPGASDQEVPVIDPRINTLVALCMNAIRDGQITAYPVNSDDVERSAAISKFIRWMLDTWIPRAYDEIELSLNNMFEKGIATTFVGWEKRTRSHLEQIDIEDIAAEAPEMAEMLLNSDDEAEVIALFQEQFAGIDERAVKKALKKLRQEGVAEIPVVKDDVSRPIVETKDISSEVIYPQYMMHPQNVTRVHIRYFMSAQDLRSEAESQGWDEKAVEDIIDNHMGVTQQEIDGPYGNRSAQFSNRSATLFNYGNDDAPDLAEIVRTFEKKIDEDTGAMGIYETVWSPKQAKYGDNDYLKYGLQNGWYEFPIALTQMTRDTKRVFDQRNLSDLLRGNQRQAKVTRDAFVDQLSIALNPPRRHPLGRPPSVWGAGATYAARRGEEGLHGPDEVPNTMRDGVNMEEYLDKEADFICGLTLDSPIAIQRQQYFINRALSHVTEIARLAYKAYQKFYEDDEIHFRITGSPDPIVFNRGPMDEELDIKFFYDVRAQDSEYVNETVKTLLSLQQNDGSGRVDPNAIIDVVTNLAVPQFANRILRPLEEARGDVIRKVAEDLSLIYSGQSVNARQGGAQVALQYLQQYVQNPEIQSRLSQDAVYAQNLQNYIQQYEFQIQQAQNAQIGRIGAPAGDITPTE